MIGVRAAFLALLLLSPLSAHAENAVGDHVVSGDEIALKDGRVLRLAGIEATADAVPFLEAATIGRVLTWQEAKTDRYGRIVALAFVEGQKQAIENAMVSKGLAFVYPEAGGDDWLDEGLVLERAARLNKTGFWSDAPDVGADDADKAEGTYGFITGRVVSAARIKNKVYVDFGPDWRSDFTITIAAHDLRAFKKYGYDPLDWQGKKLRVRGWVVRDFGPMINASDPHQIELLP